ncbi:FAD-linked oxidase C-terminal domain-containing protein [Streptomyces sp. SID13726]|uniref:FAD-linked oxidase C-terminal domain-containing protein n=1 Tax=Streptomyces sp. SID13726 TaxID=2706058 RepID=UPI001EF172D0
MAREHDAPVPRMFGDRLVAAFGQLKAVFDPLDRMNPGKVVAPYRLDENLHLGGDWVATGRRTTPRTCTSASRTTTDPSPRPPTAVWEPSCTAVFRSDAP